MEQSSSMKIKSYFADSVEQAIQEARQELGTEAMLITSRRSTPETRSLGAYEVVFGLQAASNSAGARPRTAAPAADLARDLSGELQNLRAQLQEIKSTLQGGRGSESESSGRRRAVWQSWSLTISPATSRRRLSPPRCACAINSRVISLRPPLRFDPTPRS